jgi:hypothetical protein
VMSSLFVCVPAGCHSRPDDAILISMKPHSQIESNL